MKDMDNGQQQEIEYQGKMPSVGGIGLIYVVGQGYTHAVGKFIELQIRGVTQGIDKELIYPGKLARCSRVRINIIYLTNSHHWLLFIVITCEYMSLSIVSIKK